MAIKRLSSDQSGDGKLVSLAGVGIGTTSPGSALDVKGTLRLSGATSGYVGLAPAATAGSTVYTLPAADGTNGQVLSTNSTGTLSWATPAGGSPTQVTFAEATASPNNSIFVDSMTAAGSATDIDLALSPKGAGALTAHVADSATTGGNKRGGNAVDWQTVRTAATQVASGQYSVIAGGRGHIASGQHSVVGGGYANTSSDTLTTVAGGFSNVASLNSASILGGQSNTASGQYSSIGGGLTNTASGENSTVPGGLSAVASLYGKFAYASGKFSANGDAQFGQMILRGATADAATARVLTANGLATASSVTNNTLVLGNNKVYSYKIELVANSAAAGSPSSSVYGTLGGNWSLSGLIRRTATAASTALIGIPAVAYANIDGAISGCVVALTADTTLGGLQISVNGVANTNIHWVAVVNTTEVG